MYIRKNIGYNHIQDISYMLLVYENSFWYIVYFIKAYTILLGWHGGESRAAIYPEGGW